MTKKHLLIAASAIAIGLTAPKFVSAQGYDYHDQIHHDEHRLRHDEHHGDWRDAQHDKYQLREDEEQAHRAHEHHQWQQHRRHYGDDDYRHNW
jgi:hypothetical protein